MQRLRALYAEALERRLRALEGGDEYDDGQNVDPVSTEMCSYTRGHFRMGQ